MDGTAPSGRQLVVIPRGTGQPVTDPDALLLRRVRVLLLILLGVLPIVVSIVYNALATPRYASHAAIIVRSSNSSPDRFSFMNYGQSLGDEGNNDVVAEYIKSRQIIRDLNRDGYIRRLFSSAQADVLARFPTLLTGSTEEDLYRHAQRYIDVEYDRSANIVRLTVKSFSPTEAQRLAQRILASAEAKLNALNDRSYQNLTRAAGTEVAASGDRLTGITRQLTQARKAQGVLDSRLEAPAAIKLSSAMQASLAQSSVDLTQALATAPDNPAIANMRARQKAMAGELSTQTARQVGGGRSLAERLSKVEQLDVRKEIAAKQLSAATIGLEAAKGMAQQRQLYIEKIESPGLPDRTLYDEALLNIAITAALAAGCCVIAWVLAGLFIDADD